MIKKIMARIDKMSDMELLSKMFAILLLIAIIVMIIVYFTGGLDKIGSVIKYPKSF